MTFSNIPSLDEVIVVSLLTDTQHETTTTFCDRENISISKDIFIYFSFCCCYFNFKYSSSTHIWNRVKKFRYQFVSPRYQLDPNNSTKERKNGIFLKSCSLSEKSKSVPLPFLKTLLDSFLCDETNEPNALIPSLSQPKMSRERHPHLPSYVREPTNLNPNI